MVKVLSFRFQGFHQFTTLIFEESPVTRDFLDIYLTMSLGVRSFKNKLPMAVIFL